MQIQVRILPSGETEEKLFGILILKIYNSQQRDYRFITLPVFRSIFHFQY